MVILLTLQSVQLQAACRKQYLLIHRDLPQSGEFTYAFFTQLRDSLRYDNSGDYLIGLSTHLNIVNDDRGKLEKV